MSGNRTGVSPGHGMKNPTFGVGRKAQSAGREAQGGKRKAGSARRKAYIQPSLRDLCDSQFAFPTLKRWASVAMSLWDKTRSRVRRAQSAGLFCPAPALGRTRRMSCTFAGK